MNEGLDERVVNNLMTKIIRKEKDNLKTRKLNDSEMIKWIKKQIEEDVKCCSNQ